MAFGNLCVWVSNSLGVDNPDSVPESGTETMEYVLHVEPVRRGVFNMSGDPAQGARGWNMASSAKVNSYAPVLAFSREWNARSNGGWHNLGDLYNVVVGRAGTSMAVQYAIADSSQWNLERKRNNAQSAWDGTYYTAPTQDAGGNWSVGDEYSLVDTLIQGIERAIFAIEFAGLTPRLVFVNSMLFHADAFNTAAAGQAAANLDGLLGVVADTIGVAKSEVPWHNLLLGGAALERVGAATINQAMRDMFNTYPKTVTIDPATWPRYSEGPATNYGDIYGPDHVHFTNRGCYLAGTYNYHAGRGLLGGAIEL